MIVHEECSEKELLRAQILRLREALEPFVRALEACESVSTSYPDAMSILRASFDYYTRRLGFNNDEIVERDSVRMSDLRRARIAYAETGPLDAGATNAREREKKSE